MTNDSGVYECVASNKVGSVWAAGRLLVNTSRDQPRPPVQFTCQTLSATEVQLSWDQPPTKGITAYTVHYLPTGKLIGQRLYIIVEMGKKGECYCKILRGICKIDLISRTRTRKFST